MKLTIVKTLTLASLLAVSLPPAMLVTSASPALAASALALDSDKDGTVDLNEAKAAANALFDKLDVDHDGTLDRKELKDRISAEDWKIADPDNADAAQGAPFARQYQFSGARHQGRPRWCFRSLGFVSRWSMSFWAQAYSKAWAQTGSPASRNKRAGL
jgi:hypothetical protein